MIRLFIEDSELDVNQDFSNQITYSIDDIENLDSKTTAYSKTIVLPGTANNNKLLGNLFEIGNEFANDNQVKNVGYNFNASRSAKARLESNGLLIMKGTMRLMEILVDGNNIEYEIALFGELGGFIAKVGNGKLENLDFSEYNHTYSKDEIINSWDYGSRTFGGIIVQFQVTNNRIFFIFQLVSYINIGDVLIFTGTTYNNTSYTVTAIEQTLVGTYITVSETIPHDETTSGTMRIDRGIGVGFYYPLIDYGNVSTDKHNYSYLAFRPAFYVREMLDKIITNAGYTYSSNFFNSNFFNSLIIPNNQKILNTYKTESLSISRHHKDDDYFTVSSGDYYDFISNNSYLGLFTTTDNITFKWTGADTSFRLTANNILSITHYYANQVIDMVIRLVKNGNEIYLTQNIHSTSPYSQNPKVLNYVDNQSYLMDFTFQLNTNDEIKFDFYIKGVCWNPVGFAYVKLNTSRCTTQVNTVRPILQPIKLGDNVTLNDCLPKNIFQKDFFTSIVKMFYLMITEDKYKPKHLIIEPYIDFYNLNPNTYLNWTDKVDRSEVIRIKPMSEINSRYYALKYKADKDFANDKYRVKYNQTYGDYVYDNNFDFAKDTQTTEVIFASTPLVAYENHPDDKLTSSIMKVTNGVEDNTESIIRILQRKKITDVNAWDIYQSSGNIQTKLTTYGYAGHLNDPDVPSADLNFGVPNELFFNLSAGALQNNLFNSFYSPYIAEITDINSKLFTCKMKFNETDIYNLDFSKFIWIDGILYRLLKIYDYTPGELCKVDLLKVIYTTYSDVGYPNEFDSVTINDQIWMKKNLEVSFFKNGEPINQVVNSGDWEKACDSNEPSWCYYNFDAANAGYGKLYNWYAVNDVRGLAPSGWRIPSSSDFDNLINYLGGGNIAGKHLKESGTTHWDSGNTGDNSSQFTALGAGYINEVGSLESFKKSTNYWTNESSGMYNAVNYYIEAEIDDIFDNSSLKCYGFSVRCIKN